MTNLVQLNTPPNPTVTPAAAPAPAEIIRKEQPERDAPKLSGQTADLRLVIEEDADGKGFVYKTLDRRTGEIVQVYPRDTVLKMADSARYHPGTVVDQRT